MVTQIKNLKDLFLERGKELYNAALQEQKELPLIQNQATNSELKQIINREISSATRQRSKLNDALEKFELKPKIEKDECSQSILNETKRLINISKESSIRDVAILESIQRLNHNNISSLGTLATYATEIGQNEIASSLHDLLEEEKDIDEKLTGLAKMKINKKATVAF